MNKAKYQKQVAFHEAAHAVARLYIGLPATPVEVHEDGSGLSHPGGSPIYTRDAGDIWARLVFLVAGPLAEYRIKRKSPLPFYLFSMDGAGVPGGDADQVKAAVDWLLKYHYTDSVWGAIDRAERETKKFFTTHWPAIEGVADLLLQSGFAEAAQVCRSRGSTGEAGRGKVRMKARRSGWTPARRLKAAAMIHRWSPWTKSTGPTSVSGKTRSAMNSLVHGARGASVKRLRRVLRRLEAVPKGRRKNP